ncbi:MLP-like protein 423 [Prunus dulcis]|uniref:MLP-like protein 423 n=3 Tax=Prunus dulcis TaxID=3755 RepID=A0A4Y1QMP2_PRUDU|nr:MLP-like protein 423 [Prunus dulcis]
MGLLLYEKKKKIENHPAEQTEKGEDIRLLPLTCSIRVGHKIGLNNLEQSMGPFFASFNMLFLDLNISLGVVVAENQVSRQRESGGNKPSPKLVFLMVPTPPSPSTISALLTACGAIFGTRLSASRTRALNNLGGAMTESLIDSSDFTQPDLQPQSINSTSSSHIFSIKYHPCQSSILSHFHSFFDLFLSSKIIIMGVFTYTDESTSVIPPPRLFKALVLEADTLIPKIAPQSVKSAEIVEGDGGVGTIKKISFGEGSHYSYVKHRIDGLDKDNFVYSYSLVEGDALSDKVEKISYEIKLVASADGGSIIKSTSNYHTTGDVEIKEEDVKAGKEKATGLFKLIENYLVANPDAYN